jgi:hypothetical protein
VFGLLMYSIDFEHALLLSDQILFWYKFI